MQPFFALTNKAKEKDSICLQAANLSREMHLSGMYLIFIHIQMTGALQQIPLTASSPALHKHGPIMKEMFLKYANLEQPLLFTLTLSRSLFSHKYISCTYTHFGYFPRTQVKPRPSKLSSSTLEFGADTEVPTAAVVPPSMLCAHLTAAAAPAFAVIGPCSFTNHSKSCRACRQA